MALLGGFARAPRLHLLEALEIPPSAAPRRAGYRCPQRPPRAPAPRVAAGGTPPPKMAGGGAPSARGGGWAAVSPIRAVFQRQAGRKQAAAGPEAGLSAAQRRRGARWDPCRPGGPVGGRGRPGIGRGGAAADMGWPTSIWTAQNSPIRGARNPAQRSRAPGRIPMPPKAPPRPRAQGGRRGHPAAQNGRRRRPVGPRGRVGSRFSDPSRFSAAGGQKAGGGGAGGRPLGGPAAPGGALGPLPAGGTGGRPWAARDRAWRGGRRGWGVAQNRGL